MIHPKMYVVLRLRAPDFYQVTGEDKHVTQILVLESVLRAETPGKPVQRRV